MSIHREGKVWKVKWREGKKQKSHTCYTRKDAEDYELEVKRRKSMGGIPVTAGKQDFSEFVDEWWEAHKTTLADATQDLYQRCVDNYIKPYFEGCRLHDINVESAEKFRVAMDTEGVGPAMQQKTISVLSAICTKAVKWRKLPANPVLMIDKPKAPRKKMIEPVPPERVEAIRARFGLEEAAFISCLYMTGARPAEIYSGLTWADIGQDHLILHGEKTGRDRQVRLLDALRGDLRTWREESGLMVGQVFGWTQARYKNWERKHFRPTARAEGLDITPYALRHAFVTLLTQEGKRVDYIARQLGHSIRTCEDRYRHLVEDAGDPIDIEQRVMEIRSERREATG